MMRRDTRGWESVTGKRTVWEDSELSTAVLQKRTSENKKEYKTQALSSFWVEGVPKISSYNHPKELSEGREFWRGCWPGAPCSADPKLWWTQVLDTPISEWSQHWRPCICNLCLECMLLTIEKQSPSLSGSCGQKLMLACWTCKCHWSSICVYSVEDVLIKVWN